MSWHVYHAELSVHDHPHVRTYWGYYIDFADGGDSEHPFENSAARSEFEDRVRRMVRRKTGRRIAPRKALDVAGVWCVLLDNADVFAEMREQLETRWKLTRRELKAVLEGCKELYDGLM